MWSSAARAAPRSATLPAWWSTAPCWSASPPLSQTNCPGANATFNVSATGTGLSYQWYKGSTPLSGQTASSLNLLGLSAADQAAYSVVVSGTCGTAVSNTASLVVNSPVLVAIPPLSQTNCPGANATFNVSATGTGLSYQWYKGSTPLAGQTASSLSLTGPQRHRSGCLQCGRQWHLRHGGQQHGQPGGQQPRAGQPSPPLSQTNCPGANATFNVSATGTGLSYQWYKGSTPLAGQTASSLNLTGISAADQGCLQCGRQRHLRHRGQQHCQPGGQQPRAGSQSRRSARPIARAPTPPSMSAPPAPA